ncbi:DUF6603 domain-containing protein [Catenuloplanes sp. NPDC051500]|uniref:DUF6603 domain-containing protein n=1 Tax=Catenuloplanes sp. NPDC051500 TaxID=3363959 RepID=UPI0037A2D1F0
MVIADPRAVVAALRAQPAGQPVQIDATVLPSDAAAIRTAFMLAAPFTLTGVTPADVPDPVGGELLLTGTAPLLGLASVAVTVEFTATTTTVVATMPAGWRFSDSFPGLDVLPFNGFSLAGTVFVYTVGPVDAYRWPADPAVTVRLDAGLNLLTAATLGGDNPATDLLGAIVHANAMRMYGPFQPTAGQSLPIGTLRATVTDTPFTVGTGEHTLSLGRPVIGVRITPATGETAQRIAFIVEGTLQDTLVVTAVLPDRVGGVYGLEVRPETGHGAIGELLAKLPGGSTATAHLPDELSHLFNAVALDAWAMSVDTAPPAVNFVSVSLSTTGQWTIIDVDVVPGGLILTGLLLTVEVLDPAGTASTRVLVDADATFMPTVFPGGFEFRVEVVRTTTWEVETVSGAYRGSTTIGAIVHGVTGASVPDALSAITLSDIAVVASRDGVGRPFRYSFTGGTEVAFDLLDTKVTASVRLAVEQAPDNTKTAVVGGSLMIGPEVFGLVVELGGADPMLQATWLQKDGPLSFATVADALGWDDAPTLPEGIDPAFTSAGFRYDFKTGALLFTATSDTYGQFVIATRVVDNRRLFLLDLQVPLNVTLRGLPVVGSLVPSTVDVGLDTLDVSHATAPVTQVLATALNTELAGLNAKPLAFAELPAGLTFVTALRVGSTRQAITLPPPKAPAQGALSMRAEAQNVATTGSAQSGAPAQASGVWFTVDRAFGPFTLKRIGLSYQNGVLVIAFDAGLAVGPVALSIDGLGVGSPITTFDPKVSLRGLGVAFNRPPVELLGAMLRVPDDRLDPAVDYQFDGTLVLKAATFTLAAIGSYARLKAGGSSLFVFGMIEAAIGGPPAFFVTGLMAGFGVNRSLAIPAQNEVTGFPLLALAAPPAPGQTAPGPTDVLDALEGARALPGGGAAKEWISPKAGDYWLAAGVEFTSFELMQSRLLLIVEFGSELTIAALGVSTLQLPKPVAGVPAYAYVELGIRLVLQPLRGVFEATALLSDRSYVIAPECRLTGGFAFSVWFGDNPHAGQFVATLGGYHPAFAVPDYFPTVPRLGINWAVDSRTSIKGEAYFALTGSCVMAGGGLDVQFQEGNLRAWFTAQANLLISWHPYFFTADIAVSIGAAYRIAGRSVGASMSASLKLWGPPTGGIVKVNWVVISFSVTFGSESAGTAENALDWQGFRALLPADAETCRITVTDGLSAELGSGDAKKWVVRAGRFAFQTRSAIPANTLTHDGTVVRDAAGGIAIRPMDRTGVRSVHAVTITPAGSTTGINTGAWTVTVVDQPVPASLWGAPPRPFRQLPDRPTADMVSGYGSGLSVAAPPPTPGATPGPVSDAELSLDLLQDGHSPLADARADTATYRPSTVDPVARIDDPTVTTKRDTVLGALLGAGYLSALPAGNLARLAAGAGHHYSDPPLRQN